MSSAVDDQGSPQQIVARSRLIKDLQAEVAELKREVDTLKSEKEHDRDLISSLKAETRAYLAETDRLSARVQESDAKALIDLPITRIGQQVRLRFLQMNRRRMKQPLSRASREHITLAIKAGDRAAHRGKPLADASLYLTRQISNVSIYKDLYGLTPEEMQMWKDVPAMIDTCGFHASLQSEGKLSPKFQALFERFLEATTTYSSSAELRVAFEENRALQCRQDDLRNCFDEIVHANPHGHPALSKQ